MGCAAASAAGCISIPEHHMPDADMLRVPATVCQTPLSSCSSDFHSEDEDEVAFVRTMQACKALRLGSRPPGVPVAGAGAAYAL